MKKELLEYIDILSEELVRHSNYRGYEVPIQLNEPKSEREWDELYLNYFNDARNIGLSIYNARDHATKEIDLEKAKERDLLRNQKKLFQPRLESFIRETIRKCGSKYCLISHKGKILGKHSSKKKAKSQEKAIQISKARKAGHSIPEK